MSRQKVIEHYLVPGALFCLNIAVIHAVYWLAIYPECTQSEVIACLFAVFLLCAALSTKQKGLLIGSSVIYLLLLFWAIP